MKCVVRLYNPMTSHELDPGQIEPVHSKYLVVDEDRLTERMNHIKRMGSHSLASPEELNKQSMPFELYNLRPLEDNSNTNVVQLLYKGSEEECQRYISSLGTDDSNAGSEDVAKKIMSRQFKKTRLQKKYFDSAEYFGSGGNFTVIEGEKKE